MSQFQIILYSILLILLILFAAFFSCAETSLMAVNRYRLRHQARLKKRYAIQLIQLLKRPDRILGAILIGSTFASMLASSLATLLANHFWGEEGAIIAAICLTLIVLIFAEIAPKTLAAVYADRIVKWMTYPIRLMLRLLYPFVWVANSITNGLLRLLHFNVTGFTVEPLSRDELRSVVYDTTGKISRQYQNMLLGILDLNKLTVNDVMIPLHEMVGIDLDQPWNSIVEKLKTFYQDYIPVYRRHFNQMIGVLYMHDVWKILTNEGNFNIEILQNYLRKPYFVPEGTSLYAQLNYFQQSQDRIAFIVDEYGGIQGMLTVNDILEEIVGDFTSSVAMHKRIQRQPDGSYFVDGAVTIREFNRITGFDLPLSGPKTINGLVVEYLEALPHVGTAILITEYPIEILKVKDNRVKLARVFQKLKGRDIF